MAKCRSTAKVTRVMVRLCIGLALLCGAVSYGGGPFAVSGFQILEAVAQDDDPSVEHLLPDSDDVVYQEPVEPLMPVAQERSTLATFNGAVAKVMFFDISFGAFDIVVDGEQRAVPVPFLVAFLMSGAIFYTLYFGFINIRGFLHSWKVVLGKYDDENDPGEISHFRALTSALSATVGLGNIAGVAVAINIGGPGAVFWMITAAFFGMSSKFVECTLAQLYRQQNEDGSFSGGAMYYLDLGLKNSSKALAPLGKVLGLVYALLVMGGSLGGGNMFQSNQTVEAMVTTFGLSPDSSWIIGITLALLVAAVILGGVKRIGYATSRIVPLMCGLYLVASLVVIGYHFAELPYAFRVIIQSAFSSDALFGGAVGVLITGFQRAAFSNEAGIGSSAIVHAAAKTDEPVREGLVAMIEPFVDTILICTMTALVVVVTGVWSDPSEGVQGVALTASAFATVIPWFPVVLTCCVALFAYSTMIAWCYYGERGWIYLVDQLGGNGLKTVSVFRLIFVFFVVVGAVNNLSDVIDFSDLMILSMALPNILGGVILAPKVKRRLTQYLETVK